MSTDWLLAPCVGHNCIMAHLSSCEQPGPAYRNCSLSRAEQRNIWGTTGNTGLQMLKSRCCGHPYQLYFIKAFARPSLQTWDSLVGSPCSSVLFVVTVLFWLFGLGFFLKWWNIELVVCIMLIALETAFCSTPGHQPALQAIFLSLLLMPFKDDPGTNSSLMWVQITCQV